MSSSSSCTDVGPSDHPNPSASVDNPDQHENIFDPTNVKVKENEENQEDTEESENKNEESMTNRSTDNQNEEEKNEPNSFEKKIVEEVDSQRESNRPESTNSFTRKPKLRSALNNVIPRQALKRRHSSLFTLVDRSRQYVDEEVDSRVVRSSSSRRNPKRRTIALFLENNYPGKK